MLCLECSKEVISKTIRIKKYCDGICRSKYNMKIRYLRLKDTPEYKLKIKENCKKWYNNNKERHKATMKAYMQKVYLKRRENGNR